MESSSFKIDRPLALIILDGWGYAPPNEANAVATAHTPYYDEICRSYPMTTLAAAGSAVGEADGQPGSAELGHLNLGTGRIAQTEIARIKSAVATGEFLENKVFERAFGKAKAEGSAVHVIGLISDAGVHSSTENLFAILRIAKKHKVERVFVHCILDGVDVPARTADVYVEALEIKLADIGVGEIGSVCGRYFAMDAGEHWERTARAFTMLVHAEGERSRDAVWSIRNSFLRGISDEFIAPIVMESAAGAPVATVADGDLVVFFNHRADAMRQLARSLCVPESAGMTKPVIETVCLTEYDASFNLPTAFRHKAEKNTLTEVLANRQVPNIKVTEECRVPHMTHFFDGGADVDHHVVVAMGSPMSEPGSESQSFKIADRFRAGLKSSPNGVFIVNLPAADLSGSTGDFQRTVSAIQYVDTCLGGIWDALRDYNGVAIITSAHGNCEEMANRDNGDVNPWPTANPVPFHYVDDSDPATRLADGGSLQDVAPTILGVLGIEKPAEMTGTDLRVL